jgi:hypothetical protein
MADDYEALYGKLVAAGRLRSAGTAQAAE